MVLILPKQYGSPALTSTGSLLGKLSSRNRALYESSTCKVWSFGGIARWELSIQRHAGYCCKLLPLLRGKKIVLVSEGNGD